MKRRDFLTSFGGVGIAGFSSRNSPESGYTRKYEPLENPPLDVGTVYIPFMADKWDCTPGEPSIGEYSIDDEFTINRHIDQMQGHGITTLMLNYGEGRKDFDRVRAFLNAELSSEITIETMWVIKKIFTRDLDIDLFMEFARDKLLSLPNHQKIDNRPVIQLVGSNYLPWDKETAEEIKERWGGFAEFADYIKSSLSIDGVQPYLVSSITDVPDNGISGDEAEWNKQFDAVTTWFPNPRVSGKSSWDWYLRRAEGDFQVLTEFAEEHSMDVIPTAFPGRDGRFNTCWGDEPFVPRDPSHLGDMLKVSNRFSTVNRINIATYNDWVEGHQIEPGKWNETDYGTGYLEKVEDLQLELQSTPSPTPTKTSSPTPTDTSSPAATEFSPTRITSQSDSETTTQTPGFGVLSTVAGVGGGAAFLIRRNMQND